MVEEKDLQQFHRLRPNQVFNIPEVVAVAAGMVEESLVELAALELL
jgi:hypothetical protein